jgi:hypothetical protein
MWRAERPAARNIADVVLTLYNLKKWGKLDRSGGGPILLADDRQSAYFVTLLSFLCLAPAISIRRLNDGMVKAELAALQRGGWNGQLLVPSALFKRFRGEIAPADAARRLVVV